MASPVKDAKNKIQANWLGATVHSRGKGWIKHQHPTETKRFALDTQVGNRGWHFGNGPFTEANEVDTDWVDADPILDAPWIKKMVLADYHAYFGPGTQDFNAGQIIKYVHPDSGEEITFEVQQLQWTNDLDQIEAIGDPSAVTSTVIGDVVRWDDCFDNGGLPLDGIDFEWLVSPYRMVKQLHIDNAAAIGGPPQFVIDGGNPVLRLQFIFQKSSGVEIYFDGLLWDEKSNNPQSTMGNVEFRLASTQESLWYFKQGWAEESAGDNAPQLLEKRFGKTANNLFVEIRVPWSWLEIATYPVVIDPTIDEQVGASGDDTGYYSGTGGFSSVGTSQKVGFDTSSSEQEGNLSARFPGISGLSGATIDVSYVSLRRDAENGTPLLKVSAEDAAAPAAPTSAGEFNGATLTTAKVDWDTFADGGRGFIASPSINTVIQELADSYDPSVIQIFVKDDGSGTGVDNFGRSRMYDRGAGADAPQLYIEYTEGGGHDPLVAAYGSFSLNGQVTDLLAKFILPAGQGSFALSGQVVDFLKGFYLGAGWGSFSLSGQVVDLLAKFILPAGQGSFALSGQVVDYLRGFYLAAGQGTFVLTGQDIGFAVGKGLTAEFGTFSLSGQAADLLAAFSLPASYGTFTLAGQDANIIYILINILIENDVFITRSQARDATIIQRQERDAFITQKQERDATI